MAISFSVVTSPIELASVKLL